MGIKEFFNKFARWFSSFENIKSLNIKSLNLNFKLEKI